MTDWAPDLPYRLRQLIERWREEGGPDQKGSGRCVLFAGELESVLSEALGPDAGIPMLLSCPTCGARHIDRGEFATRLHHTHSCQSCGMCWRPCVLPTLGVQFLPGFKDEPTNEFASLFRDEPPRRR